MGNVYTLCMYTISEHTSIPMYVVIVRAQKIYLQAGLGSNMFVILMFQI